jgi:TolA-binding protein
MELSLKKKGTPAMKALIAAALFASTLCFAQTTPVAPPAQQANTDPTADTNDPTLLKAQIMILDNAIQVLTGKLSPLQEFNDREAYLNKRLQIAQKLQAVMQQQTQARQGADSNKAKAQQGDKDKLKAEMDAIAKANDAKKAAAPSK